MQKVNSDPSFNRTYQLIKEWEEREMKEPTLGEALWEACCLVGEQVCCVAKWFFCWPCLGMYRCLKWCCNKTAFGQALTRPLIYSSPTGPRLEIQPTVLHTDRGFAVGNYHTYIV